MQEFTVKLKALTPIWTGDVDGKCNDLKESGIIGSLRWWYEALLRGLGFNVCDPTNESSRCKLEQKKFYEAINSGKSVLEALNKQNICPACQLFGCSGWARKFRLEINGEVKKIPEVNIGTRENRNNKSLIRKVAGLISNENITLKFRELKEFTKEEYFLLNKTLEIIANYGALGSRISQGNGVIKITKNELSVNNFTGEFSKYNTLLESKRSNKTNNNNLPNIKNFHFYKFVIEFEEKITNLIDKKAFWTGDTNDNWKILWKNHNILPIAFHTRDAIRRLEDNGEKRHDIFGELGKGSKIFVSHGYKNDNNDDKNVEVRIWGYNAKEQLEKIKNNLNSSLSEKLFIKGHEITITCTPTVCKKGSELLEELI